MAKVHRKNGKCHPCNGPLAEARREAVRRDLRERAGRIVLAAGRNARYAWQDLGLSLAQRDRAAEDLVLLGEARYELDFQGCMVLVAVRQDAT